MDAIKRIMERKKQERSGSVQPAGAAPTAKKPQAASDKVHYRCGRELPVNFFAGEDCPACRGKMKRARAEKRKAAQVAQPAKGIKGRLPHGSRKVLEWDGERQMWTGTLEVPGCPTFTAAETAERRVEWVLDDRYREWLAKEGKS